MAQSLRRPLSSVLGLSSSTSQRCFSRYAPLCGVDRMARAMEFKPHSSPDKSLRVASQGSTSQIPSDMGLLAFTYIPPKGKNLPSPFTSPNDFLHTVWNRIWYKTRDRFSLVVLKWSSPAAKRGGLRRVIKYQNSAIGPTAIALHRQMYTAFAEGDVHTLRKMCTDGIYESFRTRIGNRAKGEKIKWELLSYNKSAKVVSNRAARLPIDGAALVQTIVRISSKQRLTRWRKEKEGLVQIEGTGNERDVVEYVVLQKLYKDWKADDWMVWGTTKETTLDDVDEFKRMQKAEIE